MIHTCSQKYLYLIPTLNLSQLPVLILLCVCDRLKKPLISNLYFHIRAYISQFTCQPSISSLTSALHVFGCSFNSSSFQISRLTDKTGDVAFPTSLSSMFYCLLLYTESRNCATSCMRSLINRKIAYSTLRMMQLKFKMLEVSGGWEFSQLLLCELFKLKKKQNHTNHSQSSVLSAFQFQHQSLLFK